MKINHGRGPESLRAAPRDVHRRGVGGHRARGHGQVMVNNVFFAREHGRTAPSRGGSNPLRDERGGPRGDAGRGHCNARRGDTVWFRPAKSNGHGAAPDSYVVHLAVSSSAPSGSSR